MIKSSLSAPRPRPGETVDAFLLRVQRRQAVLTVVLPTLGAVAWLFRLPEATAGKVAMLVVMFALGTLGITVGYHRMATHRAFEAPSWLRRLLLSMGALAAQGPPLFWCATHRKHHQCVDTNDDPHSPVTGTRGHAHVGWMFTVPPCDPGRYARDLSRDPDVQWVGRRYNLLLLAGIVVPAVIGAVAWGSLLDGLLWGGLFRIFVGQHITWSINSICHAVGAQPWRARGGSRNVWWLALPSMGESWHNNHHADPRSARQGFE